MLGIRYDIFMWNAQHTERVMEGLDPPILWGDIKKSTTKLGNDKSPGLNGLLPNTFKALNNENTTWLLIFYNQFWHS